MKKIIFASAALLFAALTLSVSSCKKDEKLPAKPVITLTEVGHENSKQATIGDDMHLEAKIVAKGTIKSIFIEIHQENGGTGKVEKKFTEGKYIGVKNCEFHEHIDIPATFTAGKYHLHFTVTDESGQSATAESDVTVKAAEGK